MSSLEPIRLRGVAWDHPRGVDSVRAGSLGARWRDRPVVVDWTARSLRDFGDEPLGRLVRRFDLLVVDHPHIPDAATTGLLAAVTAGAPEAVGRSGRSYEWDGRRWALPIDAAAQVTAFRPDLLPEPPSSWDELLAGPPVLWPGAAIDAFSSLFALASADGWSPSEPSALPFDAAKAVRGLDVLRRLRERVPPALRALDPIGVLDLLSTTDEFGAAPLVFGYTNYARVGFRPHRLRFTDAPEGLAGRPGSLLGGAGIAVSAWSADREAAAAVAVRLASSSVQRGAYFDGGGQPAAVEAWEDDRLDEETGGFFRATRRTLEAAVLRPRRTGWMAFQDRMRIATADALDGALGEDAFAAAWESARAALSAGTPGT